MREYHKNHFASLITEELTRQGSEAQAIMVQQKFAQLDTESTEIIKSIAKKPGRDGIQIYSKEEIGQFQSLCDMIIAELMKKYSVNAKRLKRYRSKLSRGEYPGNTPYTTYDSGGGIPRTLVKPIQE